MRPIGRRRLKLAVEREKASLTKRLGKIALCCIPAVSYTHLDVYKRQLWCILGFVLLHFFTRKLRRYDGQTFLLYVMWYGLGRFFIEGLRQDSLIIPGTGLRVSQVVALVSVLTAVVLLIVFRNKTSLSGCGAKDVMAMNAVVDDCLLYTSRCV